jgi:hypothetical protein
MSLFPTLSLGPANKAEIREEREGEQGVLQGGGEREVGGNGRKFHPDTPLFTLGPTMVPLPRGIHHDKQYLPSGMA